MLIPIRRPPRGSGTSICTEAKRIARLALQGVTFAALPSVALDASASAVAGDFNVHYPDNTGYTGAQIGILGGANAYAALTAGTSGARNQEASTRIGPTAYKGQRVYTLKNPRPIQHINNAAADYVPLNVTGLAGVGFMGFAAWVAGLQNLAAAQHAVWAQLIQPPYSLRLDGAFDQIVIDDTSFYPANC